MPVLVCLRAKHILYLHTGAFGSRAGVLVMTRHGVQHVRRLLSEEDAHCISGHPLDSQGIALALCIIVVVWVGECLAIARSPDRIPVGTSMFLFFLFIVINSSFKISSSS